MEFLADSLVDLGNALPGDVQRYFIDRGYTGTKQTIEKMQQCVSWGKRWPGTRRAVSGLISDVPRKDYLAMVDRIFSNVQDMQYVFDPSGVEAVQGPDVTADLRMGDCDDFSVKLATDCESIGIPCYFKTVKAKPGSSEFTHVYVVAVVPGVGKVPMDATMPYPLGWEAAGGQLPSKEWPSSFDEQEIHGGGEGSSMNGLATLPPELRQYGLSCGNPGYSDGYVSPAAAAQIARNIQTMPPDRMHADNEFTLTPSLGNLPIEAGFGCVESESLNGLDCMECGGTCGQSLTGLDSLGDPQGDATIGSVMDGSAYSELRAAKDQSNQNQVQAGSLLTAAQQLSDPSQRAQAMQLYNQIQASVTAERQSLQQAINAYSKLAGWIQTFSLGVVTPQQLSGLGVAPIIVATIVAAVGAGVIYVVAQAYYTAMAAWRGQTDNTRGLIQQLTDFLAALGKAPKDAADGLASIAKTVAIVAAVGAVLFVGFKLIRRKEG